MEPLDTLLRWLRHTLETLGDRARARTFFRFLLSRFLDDRLFQAAGALSFTTAFALVPLSMVVFGVLSAFPVYDQWSDQLSHYIFANFVPSSAREVEAYLRELSKNTGQLTAVGVIVLVVSLLITLNGIEAAFNRIWRVPTARPKFGRFLVYWTVLTFGALLAAASLAMSARFFALSVFNTAPGQWLETWLLRISPILIEWLALTLVYRVVPHRTIQWRFAMIGAALAAVVIEAVKWGVGLYLGGFATYQKIYGALALIPIFMGWIYFSWIAILLGASLASSLSAFRYQPASQRLPIGYELYGLLRLIGRFQEARGEGKGLHLDDIRRSEPMLTDALVQQMLGQLSAARVLSRAESGEWLLARDLDDVSLADLYETCHLRIPIAEAWLPARDDALGEAAFAALDDLRVPLRDLLRRPVAGVYRKEHSE
ncbi:MAG: YihY family inner membrane protein [Xanthomonadaceae bacterium]|nr:YihY family inner membrane protein [Xanthomonadaceae bacterium]